MPALSVIVPVYNVENYLEWCLDSLRAQTFSDIEIVCVNDGSTDNSRAILSRCQEKDNRIVIVDKPNGGLSSARNAGIKAATADIVCFLDSDDRFTPNACEVIVDTFNSTNAEVVTFGANCYPEEAGYPWLEEHLSPRSVVYEPFHKDLLFKEMSRPFAWRTACKRTFIVENNLFFNEDVKFGEDQVFHFAIYPRSKKTVLIADKLYDYRVAREGSLMATIASDLQRKGLEHVPIARAILSDWKNEGLLACYSADMLNWVVEFNVYEALSLPVDQVGVVLNAVGNLITEFWSKERIAQLGLPKATLDVVKLCLENKKPSRIDLLKKKATYRIQQDGLRSFAVHMIKR